jgi:hypothetical protein
MKIPSKALALGAAVVVVAAGTFGAFRFASAQEATPSASTPTASAPGESATPGAHAQVKQDFLQNLASSLNVSVDTLKSDLKSAGLQTVDQAVQSGKLTTAQAAKIKDAISNGKLGALRRFIGRARLRVAIGLRMQIVKSAATAINIQPSELRSELKSGKSIADVAQEHNVSIDTVKTQITNDVKAKLDQAVKNGKISQQREDSALARLQANLDKIVNHVPGQKPAPSATPGA